MRVVAVIVVRVLGILSLVIMFPLAGCTVTVNPVDGPTAGTEKNSAFTKAGNVRIISEGRATINLRGPLLSTDLGANTETPLQGFDVRGEDPIQVTLLGTKGKLVVQADVITFLLKNKTDEVESIALFESQKDLSTLGTRMHEVADTVGFTNVNALENWLARLPEATEKKETYFNGGSALGFTVDLHPYHRPGEYSLIEYDIHGGD